MRFAIFAMFLLMGSHGVARELPRDLSDELKHAQKALAANDYISAYDQYAIYAGTNPLAMFTLGLFEQQGWGRSVNQVAACEWFEKAAEKKIPAAQQFLGDCFANGIGRQVDGFTAIRWYRDAANAGISYALCSAGALYITGKLVPKDVNQGLALCTAAAQAESPPAMIKLANYYREGSEVPQNFRFARFWYEQAAQRHNHEAQFRLGIMLSEGQGGDVDTLKGRFWLERAASEGYAPAYLPTAILYANAPVDATTGALTPNDLAKVYMWNSAAKATTSNPVQLAEINRIETLVVSVMPAQWKPDLEKRVQQHLAKYNAEQAR